MKIDFKTGTTTVKYLQGTSRTDIMKTKGKLFSNDIIILISNSSPMDISEIISSDELSSLGIDVNKGKTYKYIGTDTTDFIHDHIYMVTGASTFDDLGVKGSISKIGTGYALRDYVPDIIVVEKPSLLAPSADYTGGTITNGYTRPTGVDVSGDESGVNGGTYTAIYTPQSSYMWNDGTTESVTVVLTINYVWNRYSVSYGDAITRTISDFWSCRMFDIPMNSQGYYATEFNSAPILNLSTGLYNISSGSYRLLDVENYGTSHAMYIYDTSVSYTTWPYTGAHAIYSFTIYAQTNWDWYTCRCWDDWGLWNAGYRHEVSSSRGSYETQVRSTSESAYPNDGISNGKWYTRV